MEADNLIPDENIAGFSKRILEREYEEIAKMSVAVIVATAFDVIHEYREKGMTFDQIASAYTKNGVPMKGATLRWAFGRAMKSRKSIQDAPPARVEGGQRGAKPSPSPEHVPAVAAVTPDPVVAAVKPSPSPAPAAHPPPAPAPRQSPAPQPMPLPGQKKEERRPFGMSEEMWALKPKIDKILTSYPTPDREYPELADVRWWTDSGGKKWDMRADEKPDTDAEFQRFDRARIMYSMRWRGLMEKWGLAQDLNGELIPRYKIAEEYLRPLAVDLDQIIAKHLD